MKLIDVARHKYTPPQEGHETALLNAASRDEPCSDHEEDQELMACGKDASKNTRKCLVTGVTRQKSEMIRCVRGPEGVVTPDLGGKLPGRGVWITADRESLLKAADDHRVFIRGFKDKSVRLTGDPSTQLQPSDFVDSVVKLQYGRVLEAFGLCRRSGELVTGFDKVHNAVKACNHQDVLIIARDAGKDGSAKLQNIAARREILVIDEFESRELSQATGFDAIGYLFVSCASNRKTGGQPGRNVRKEILRYQAIRGDIDVSPE